MKERPYAYIAGGGTGGHLYPALAIADALVAKGHAKGSIHFVGSHRGIEARVLPDSGYPFTLFSGRGIKRRLSVDNIGAIGGLLAALLRALIMVGRNRPKVVVSVGGYAAAPCAIAAAMFRVPLVLAESNAIPGAVHRLVARFATASAVALPGTKLPNATITGTPVRADLVSLDRSPDAKRKAREALGLPTNATVIGVFGGSLGSRTINGAVFELVDKWSDRADVAIHHVVGKRDWNAPSETRPVSKANGLTYKAVEYEDRMPLLYEAADIMICRAGGTTVAEVAAAGIPAIFVPLPNAPGDHQTGNAQVFVSVDAAVLVPDGECDGARIERELDQLIGDAERLQAMGKAARGLAVPNAADRVADIVLMAASSESG